MSAYDVYSIRNHRKLINHPKDNFFLTHKDQSVKNNKPIAFTFTGEDFIQCRRSVNKQTTKEYLPPLDGHRYPSQKLTIGERWSARHFKFQRIFEKVSEAKAAKIELEWYYDVSTWQGYCDFVGSKYFIETAPDHLTKPHKHVKIPYTEGNLDEDT